MTAYRRFDDAELAAKRDWLNRFREALYSVYTGYQPDGGEQADLAAIEFLAYEGVDICDDKLFRKGALFVFGDALVGEHGAEWLVRVDGRRLDFVLSHAAFPEPVVMRLLHEYCDTKEFEELAKDGEPVKRTPDGKMLESVAEVIGWAAKALTARIRAHQRGFAVFWDKREWRKDAPFSIGVDAFPPL